MSNQSDIQDYEEAQQEFTRGMASLASGGWITDDSFRATTGQSYSDYAQEQQKKSYSNGSWYCQMSRQEYEDEYQLDTPEERAQMIAYYAEQDRRRDELRNCATQEERDKLLAHYAELDKSE